MILRSLGVEGYRRFAGQLRLEGFSEGVTVIFAPNGTGKSTLFEALGRVLFDDHRVTGKEAEGLRPWGRALAPQVTVELTAGGVDYRIHKRFLDEPRARLERREGGKYAPLAEGEACVRKVRDLLGAATPGRGLSQLRHWGLAQVLWAAQGEVALEELAGGLLESLEGQLGARRGGEERESGPFERKIESLHERYFTEKGKLKAGKDGAPLNALRRDLEVALEEERAARAAQAEYEDAVRRLEDLRGAASAARQYAVRLGAEHEKARAAASDHEKILGRRRELEAQLSLARMEQERLEALEKDLLEHRALERKAREELQRLEQLLPLHEASVAQTAREEAALSSTLEDARAALDRASKERDRAQDAQRLSSLAERVRGLRAEEVRRVEQRRAVETARLARDELVAPDARVLQALRRVTQERAQLDVLLEAALITLQIVPERDGDIEVTLGDAAGSPRLSGGVPFEARGAPQVAVNVPGFGRIRARGPSGSAEDLRARRDAAISRLADLARPFGVRGLEELEALHERREGLARKLAEEEARLSALLPPGGPEASAQELRAHELAIAEILARQPDWKDAPVDAGPLLAQAESVLAERIATVRATERAREACVRSASQAREALTQHSSQITALRRDLERLSARLGELTADGRSDLEREAALGEAALRTHAARTEVETLSRRLAGQGFDPIAEAERLGREARGAAEALAEKERQEQRAEGTLATLAQRGTYSALAAREERRAELERSVAREALRMDAIELLHRTVREARQEVRELFTEPVRKAATRILERIAGRRLGSLEVGEGLLLSGVRPEGAEGPVELERISGGEREQAHFALRFALAELLGRAERQLVVLDDVFGATDSGRLSRICGLIEESAVSLQTLIFTCHPERFRGIRGAAFIDLEEKLGGAA